MAVETHFAELGLFHVNPASGRVYQRGTGGDLTIKESLVFETQQRVVEKASNDHTSGNPTLEEYLQLEAEDDFQLKEVNQSFVVTEKIT